MGSLEDKVREGFIKQEAEDMYGYMQTPEFQEDFKSSIDVFNKTIRNSVAELTEKGNLGRFEKFLLQQMIFMAEKQADKLKNTISNPKKLKQIAYDIIKKTDYTTEGTGLKFETMYNELKESGKVGNATLEEFKKTYEKILYSANKRKKMIKELVKIAENEGIEKALTKEAKYKAVREVFPTPDEYISCYENALESVYQLFDNLNIILATEGKSGQTITPIISGLQESFKKLMETSDKYRKEHLQEEVKNIYKQ